MAAGAASSNNNGPCAACKAQRRKCTAECVFAPHFPPEDIEKFQSLHRVYGAGNVSKLLSALPPESRGEAVTSLAYEAEARLRSPVYGCVGMISLLQQRLRDLDSQLSRAQSELSSLRPGPAIGSASGDYSEFFEYHRQRLREDEAARVALEQQQRALMGFQTQTGTIDDISNWLTVAGGFSNPNYGGDVAGSSSTGLALGGGGDGAYYYHQQQQFQYHHDQLRLSHGYDHQYDHQGQQEQQVLLQTTQQPSQEQYYHLGKLDDQGNTTGLAGNPTS